MSTPIARRTLAALLAGGAMLLAALAAAPRAEAAVIYVCVKKSDGAMRLVSKSSKCKHGEKKLSWTTEGPAGKNGSNGSNGLEGKPGGEGKAGANGAVSGFSAVEEGTVAIDEYVLRKKLPAGHYLISANAQVFGRAKTEGKVLLGCELDVEGSEVNAAETLVPLLETGVGRYEMRTTLSTQAAVTLSSSATIGLYCYDLDASVTFEEIGAYRGMLDALQVDSVS